MPRRTLHRRRRAQGGCLSFAIGALTLTALALVAAIWITSRFPGDREDVVAPNPQPGGSYVDAGNISPDSHQMVLTAGDLVVDENIKVLTPSPTPSPEPTAPPEPTYNPDDPYGLVRPRPTAEGYLPVFTKANTDKKQIAITLDECSGATITSDFAAKAVAYDAKLTLFPTGENVMRSGMDQALQNCYFMLGFEIENRCYSTISKLYGLNDTMMAGEIWKQSIAVSYVLGGKYQCHFLRLYGRQGENDLRTHTYLMQEGYKGIAGWTYNGSLMEEGRIGNNLAPGNIYYFKSNEEDLRRMEVLMKEAKQQGYEMVTLNELFGYERNEFVQVNNVLAENMPELKDHNIPYYFMKVGDCTWGTNLLQRRLMLLGYLPDDSADGVYGNSTAAAIGAFQARMNLPATGPADVLTQELLYADDAPMADE